MAIVKPKTKEQAVHFLISHISLGTYDKRFLHNIEDGYCRIKKPVTSNQAKLLDKVILRYHKQLAKLEVNSNELINLPWNIKPIDSLPQYTEVYLDLIDDTLVLRCPYKKEFVFEFKKNEFGAKWDSESRFWYIPASTYNLKIVNQQIIKHYTKINYCEHLTNFFNSIKDYDKRTYWNPTYKYVSGNFMIVSTNRWLDDALKNITFDDSPHTLSQLAWYGVEIDESIITLCNTKHDPALVAFSSKINPQIEANDLSVIDKLINSGVDFVFLYYRLSRGNIIKQIVDLLKLNNIAYYIHDPNVATSYPPNTYKHPVIIIDRNVSDQEEEITKKFAKIIKAVNSKPINIT